MKEALNDINKEQNNIILAMELRGYQQINIEGDKISFRRIDNEQNQGDTRDWVFQYNNWSEVKEALKYVPLWEPEEVTKKVNDLIETFEEHYTKMENAGYEIFPFNQKGLDEMNQEEMKSYIQSFYRGIDEKIICTSRISEALATTICQMIKKKQLSSEPGAVEELLMKDNTLKFIQEREPYVEPVPEQVIKSVKEYFEHKFLQMTPIEIFRMSNHKEDDYLYGVIAVQGNGKYACWTSWNQHSESMNFGHYDLSTKEIAVSIIDENFNDISDDKEMFGPFNSRVVLENTFLEECCKAKVQNDESVIISFRNRNRGR